MSKKEQQLNIDIMLVCSVGGHLTQLLNLKDSYKHLDYLFVVNDRVDLTKIMINKTKNIYHAERNFAQVYNIIEAFILLKKYRPKVILSNGASPGVVFEFVGKYFFHCKTIFIESASRIKKPSLSARLAYYFVDEFYVQWEGLLKEFKNAKFKGRAI